MPAKNLSGLGNLFDDRRIFYIQPNVVKELWTSEAPFTTLVANRNTVTGLSDPLFKMFEHRAAWIKQQFPVTTAITITANNTESADLTVGTPIVGLMDPMDSSYIGLELEIWDATETTKRGVVFITSVGSGTIKVKVLGTSDITTVSGDIFRVCGNVRGEGTVSPEAWADDLRIVFGSTQIMRTPVNVTGTLYQAALRGYSKELERLRIQKSQEHKMQKERTFLFGTSVLGTNLDPANPETFTGEDTSARTDADGNVVRSTLGIIPAIDLYGKSDPTAEEQNNFEISVGSYTFANFVDQMQKVFFYYPEAGVKYAFAGPTMMSYWSKLDGNSFLAGQSGWTVRIDKSQLDPLGYAVRQLETPHGILKLTLTPALRGPYNGTMVVVSDNNLSHVIYRPPQFKANIKTDNAYDGEKDEYFSDEGIGLTLIESHKKFKLVA